MVLSLFVATRDEGFADEGKKEVQMESNERLPRQACWAATRDLAIHGWDATAFLSGTRRWTC